MPATARILGPNGRPLPAAAPPPVRPVRARYDAAESNQENAQLWLPADGLSARSANSPLVRFRLRTRARYETANNSYARGIVETLANDCVGTGPRLQLLTPDEDLNRRVAGLFEEWTCAVGLAEKLRTMRKSRAVDGEAFALLTSNPRLPTPVQLDLRLIEADQVSTPGFFVPTADAVDGIVFDKAGNPREYHVLQYHPGDAFSYTMAYGEFDRVPADLVLHWFRVDRPEQARGIPDVTPALPLFALLRRFTLAVLAAAETAADFAAVITTDMAPDGTPDGGAVEVNPFDTTSIDRRMMTALPAGYKMDQFKAEQPATTYKDFKGELLNEIARCLNMPFNIAAGNSSGYNYSSGRLDHQTYYKSVGIDQYHLETCVLDRLFMAWLEEAYLTRLIDQTPDRLGGWPHQWYWDAVASIDPVKDATASTARLTNRTTTLAQECAAAGVDWRAVAEQQARERKYYAGLGLPYPGDPPPMAPAPQPTPAKTPTDGGDGHADPNAD